jgi:hypothetical protein
LEKKKVSTEVRSVFEGLKPAKCWGHYDERHSACTKKCKVSQFCKPVTARRKAGQAPTPVAPPQPEKIEPIAEPNPHDYLLDLIRGKAEIKFNRKASNDKLDVHIVVNGSGKPIMKVAITKDGSNRVMVQSGKGKNVFTVDSLEAAEKAFASL